MFNTIASKLFLAWLINFPTPLSNLTSPKLSEPRLLSNWYNQYSPKISKLSDSIVLNAEVGIEVQAKEEININSTRAVIPVLQGQAWITGEQTLYLDKNNPFPQGYRLTDTWPEI